MIKPKIKEVSFIQVTINVHYREEDGTRRGWTEIVGGNRTFQDSFTDSEARELLTGAIDDLFIPIAGRLDQSIKQEGVEPND